NKCRMRERHDIAINNLSFIQTAFDQATGIIESSPIVFRSKLGRTREQHLHNLWSSFSGLRSQDAIVNWRLAPVQEYKANLRERLFDNLTALLRGSRIAW